MAECWGIEILNWGSNKPDYKTYLGLWLQRDLAISKKALPLMMGIGTSFGGKMAPELLENLVDIPEQGKILSRALQQKEMSKIPLNNMPKEFKKAIQKGNMSYEDLRMV